MNMGGIIKMSYEVKQPSDSILKKDTELSYRRDGVSLHRFCGHLRHVELFAFVI